MLHVLFVLLVLLMLLLVMLVLMPLAQPLTLLRLRMGGGSISEVGLFGFARFKGPQIGPAWQCLGWPRDFADAAERPKYTSLNTRKGDVGVPAFGDVSLVLSPSYAHAHSFLTPIDTGDWEIQCNSTWHRSKCASFPAQAACQAASGESGSCVWLPNSANCEWNASSTTNAHHDFNCSVWESQALGTFDSFDHLILANARLRYIRIRAVAS